MQRVELDDTRLGYTEPVEELLAIDEALERLACEIPQAAQLVKLRYFAGVSIEDAAEVVGFSRSTAYEHWAYARAWLHRHLRGPQEGGRGVVAVFRQTGLRVAVP
jgi:DNA-directed RNA polymerase specialized sigma24 family protein